MPHVFKAPSNPEEAKGPRVVNPKVHRSTPSAAKPVGRWMAYHSTWQAPLYIKEDGDFVTESKRDGGTWLFDGRFLTLRWGQSRLHEKLELQGDGTFFMMVAQGSFTLRRS